MLKTAAVLLLITFTAQQPYTDQPPPTREDYTVMDAAAVLREIQAVPDQCIPTKLLREAKGLIVIPGMKKVGFLFEGHFGKGIAVVRREDGTWSPPIFVRMGGVGFGAQAGVEAQDLILVCKTERSMRWLYNGSEITLGVDLGAAAGPVGRDLKAGTNLQLNAEMLSYSRSRGLFAGVAVSGGRLRVDWNALAAYYRVAGLGIREIIKGTNLPVPASAVRFDQTLAAASNAPPVEVGTPPPQGPGR